MTKRKAVLLSIIVIGLLAGTGVYSVHSSSAQTAEVTNWQSLMLDAPPQNSGCFQANYPTTAWQPITCSDSTYVPVKYIPVVGAAGGDYVASVSGTTIGDASGHFSTMSGFSKEVDNFEGSNYFSLQINSQFFSCNTVYTASKSATCWEQFVFQNYPGSNLGEYYIEYALAGYYSTYGSCPPLTDRPPGGSSWTNAPGTGDCYANTAVQQVSLQQASNLVNLAMGGAANLQSNGYDEVLFCVSTTCNTYSETDGVLNLYQSWTHAEWNVLGVGGGSEANFNPGVSVSATTNLYNPSNSRLNPTCSSVSPSYTGESNNLWSSSCSVSSYQMVYTETD